MARERVVKKITLRTAVAGPGAGSSAQQDEERDTFTPDDAITPPANLEQLAALTQTARHRRSCIEAVVVNTVGRGFELRPVKGREENVSEEDIATLANRLDEMARKDSRRHKPNFTRQMKAVKWDNRECGNGYLEVSRNAESGEIDGLFHVVGKRIRRTKDRKGWIMVPPGGSGSFGEVERKVRFINFGEKVVYDESGQATGKLSEPDNWPASTRRQWATNELIPFQLYTSESRDYGLPPDSHLAIDYLADSRAANSNAGFFDGSGVPPSICFITVPDSGADGDEVTELEIDPDTIQRIVDTMRTETGPHRRIAFIPLPEGMQAQVEQLAVLSDRDVGFVNFRSDNRRATLSAHRLAPIFIADIEDTNYSTAQTEREITEEQTFSTERADDADVLNSTLIRELAGGDLEIIFTPLNLTEDDAKRQAANDAADRSVMTRGEYREEQNLPPLPEAAEGADPDPAKGEVPHGWNSELMPARTAGPAAPPPGEPAPADIPPEEQIIKAEFDEAVDEAIHSVAQLVGPGVALKPVVIEKDGDTITISPHNNGTGE